MKIVDEVEKCKLYYGSVYEVIGKHFVIYDRGSIKHYVQNDLMAKNTSYVLESTAEGKTQFVKRHLAMFESYKHTTKNECKVLIMYLSEKGLTPDSSVVHEKLKAIEMRLEETKYHCTLLTSLVAKEGRCHEIAEELKSKFLTEQTMNAEIQKCCGHSDEVQRLWKLVEEREPMTILSDVHFITSISKTMERRRNNVFSILMLSQLGLKVLGRRMSNLVQIMDLRARLRKELHEILYQLPDTYHRHQEELNKLNLLSEIINSDPIVCFRSFSSQELVLFVDQANALDKLSKEIHLDFADECICSDQITSLTRVKLLKRASSWSGGYFIPEVSRIRWMILTNENIYQWKTVVQLLKTENYDINVLKSHFDKAVSWHYEAKSANTTIVLRWILHNLVTWFVRLVILFLLLNQPQIILSFFLIYRSFM